MNADTNIFNPAPIRVIRGSIPSSRGLVRLLAATAAASDVLSKTAGTAILPHGTGGLLAALADAALSAAALAGANNALLAAIAGPALPAAALAGASSDGVVIAGGWLESRARAA